MSQAPQDMSRAPATPLVKVCGLTRAEDVGLAVDLGAWAVGFVFARSPRQITPEQAETLVAAARAARRPGGSERRADTTSPAGLRDRPPLTVGVFGDTTTAAIVEVIGTVGLDAVQLHGSEPRARELRDALGERGAKIVVIQAIPVPATGGAAADLRTAVAAAGEAADLLLFDTRDGGRFGGAGRPFPWALALEAAGGTPFLVAGGIGAHNIRRALSVSHAAGVDVSSGVESSPGVKDEGLIRALFAAARRAEDEETREGRRI